MSEASTVIPVDVLLGSEWVAIDIDADGFTFRELDVLRGELLKLNEPTVHTQKLLAAWLQYRRSHPDTPVDVFLDLPFRALRDGEREASSPEV